MDLISSRTIHIVSFAPSGGSAEEPGIVWSNKISAFTSHEGRPTDSDCLQSKIFGLAVPRFTTHDPSQCPWLGEVFPGVEYIKISLDRHVAF